MTELLWSVTECWRHCRVKQRRNAEKIFWKEPGQAIRRRWRGADFEFAGSFEEQPGDDMTVLVGEFLRDSPL